MNSDEKRPAGATSPDPEVVADLIRSAGRRAAPPETAYNQALDVATNAWRLKVEQMQRRRRYLQIATGLAAGIATLAVLLAILPRDERAPTVRVAALERIIGTLEAPAHGRCRLAAAPRRLGGPGRRHAAADRRKQSRWTQALRRCVAAAG